MHTLELGGKLAVLPHLCMHGNIQLIFRNSCEHPIPSCLLYMFLKLGHNGYQMRAHALYILVSNCWYHLQESPCGVCCSPSCAAVCGCQSRARDWECSSNGGKNTEKVCMTQFSVEVECSHWMWVSYNVRDFKLGEKYIVTEHCFRETWVTLSRHGWGGGVKVSRSCDWNAHVTCLSCW